MQEKIESYECEIKQLKSQILNLYKGISFNPRSPSEALNTSQKISIGKNTLKKPSNSLNQQSLQNLIKHAGSSISKSFIAKKSQDENQSLLGMDVITDFSESVVKSPRYQWPQSKQNENLQYSDFLSFIQLSASALEDILLTEY